MTSIQYRLGVGIGVPIVLLIIGIMGKRLARGPSSSWLRADFYLGVELTLAGVSSSLLNVFDFLKPGRVSHPSDAVVMLVNVTAIVFGILFFLFVLTLHQTYALGNPPRSRTKELLMLAGLSNVLGFSVLVASVIAMPVTG